MAFSIAISGLKAATSDLNVIGNNVANANTTGFKKSRVEFADVFSATGMGIATSVPVGSSGLGVRATGVTQEFTQGIVRSSDRGLDLAINGAGFFMVEDTSGPQFTRAGAFNVDKDGYVSNTKGQKLVAFKADENGLVTGSTGAIQITSDDAPPKATTNIDIGLNLEAAQEVPPATVVFDPADGESYNHATSTTVFDSQGTSHLATMYYRKTADNTWDSYLYVDGEAVGGAEPLTFDSEGILLLPANGEITATFTPEGGAAEMTMTLDYSHATQFGSKFGVSKLAQDGYANGKITSLDTDPEGRIIARYSNGQSILKGQIALANFPNPQALQPAGDTSWGQTYGSGDPLLSPPGTSGLGLIAAGALEESNVDLSEELVDMIIAQRNYQANAQVISTANEVTQTIINL